MTLTELAKRLTKMQDDAKAKRKASEDAVRRAYFEGAVNALKQMQKTVQDARQAERLRQQLARLDTTLGNDPVLDWSSAPQGSADVVSIEKSREQKAA